MIRLSASEPGGKTVSLPRGSLTLSPPRELWVGRSYPNAFEADGSAAEDTLRYVDETPMVAGGRPGKQPATEPVHVHGEEVVWGGEVMIGYGHFLCESTARLWPLVGGADLEGAPVVFTPEGGRPRPEPSFAPEWLSAFGSPRLQLPESGMVRFEKMIVPEPAWRLGAWIAPEIRDVHLHARAAMEVRPRRDDAVVWLSRGKLKYRRIPYDEALLEWLLGDHVRVVSPETMSLPEQVAAIETGRGVAGVVGSAFHTLLLAAKPPDCLYMCPSWGGAAQMAQHRLLDCDATFARGVLSPVWTRHTRRRGIVFPFGYRLSIPKALRALAETILPSLLDDPRLAAFADPERHFGGSAPVGDELDTAIAKVLLDPVSLAPRASLAAAFEARGVNRCAHEQLQMIEDLGGRGEHE